MSMGQTRESDCGGAHVRAKVSAPFGRGRRRERRGLAAVASTVVLAALALGVGPAAAPASAAIVVGEPHLTLKSTYEGELHYTAHAEPAAGEVEDLKVTEKFTVGTEQRVDIQGHT